MKTIGYFVTFCVKLAQAAGLRETAEISPIAKPEGSEKGMDQAKVGKANFSKAKAGEVYIKVLVGSTAEHAQQALESLVMNARRFNQTGFIRIDKKLGEQPTKRLIGGNYSADERASAKALILQVASDNPQHAELLEAGRKALVFEATQKRDFTRKVLYVDAITGDEVGIPPVPVQTGTYGKEGTDGEQEGNDRLTARVAKLGLRVVRYVKLEKPGVPSKIKAVA